MTKDEALRTAYSVLSFHAQVSDAPAEPIQKALDAIEEALAQPVQEPTEELQGQSGIDIEKQGQGLESWANAVWEARATPPTPPVQEPVAEVKAKMTGGNVGIATVIHEIFSPHREPLRPGDKLYAAKLDEAAPPLPVQPVQEPDCLKCGNNRQVWTNQITGLKTCHRVGCTWAQPVQPVPISFLPGELELMTERGRKAWDGVELVDGHIVQPVQRTWAGLTEQQRNDIENDFKVFISIHVFDAIEAKLKEKNT